MMMRAIPPVLLLAVLVTAEPALAAESVAGPEETSVRERIVLPGSTLALEVRYLHPLLPCTGDWVEFDVTLENLAQGGPGPYTGSIENVIPGGTVYEPGSVSGGAVFDPEGQAVLWQGPLDVGESKTIGFTLTIGADLPPGILIVNWTLGTVGQDSISIDTPLAVCGDDGGFPQAPPELAPWLSSPELPDFEAKVLILPAGQTGRVGAVEPDCIAETLCVSGALEGRPELFIKVLGPRPNGFLWAQVARFTPSRVVIWLRQVSTGFVRHYELDATGPGHVPFGLQDRQAFFP